ncbi:MAG TPA: four-helix bundle copper-binding protein [Gemmatimonadaceae bacterium]
MPHHQHMDTAVRDCIQECLACYQSCLESVHHCLMVGGAHAAPGHVALLLACATACEASARVTLLGAEQHAALCAACSTVCRQCAEACRQMAGGDETMARCAAACDRCAESCERMARRST